MTLSCVMVVDDSEPDQFISKLTIEQYDSNITILQAYDGVEALEVLESSPEKPELIFLDINMPRMNGHEFLAAYDKVENNSASVIIMLTSSDQKKDVDGSRAYQSVKAHFAKPLDLEGIERAGEVLTGDVELKKVG